MCDFENIRVSPCEGDNETVQATSPNTKEWNFRVVVKELEPSEKVCVVGDCEQLGNWKHDKVVILNKASDGNFSIKIDIPADINVQYRYCLCLIDKTTKEVLVTKWETHMQPRIITPSIDTEPVDVFGVSGDEKKIDQGWLSAGFLTQLKFYGQPFKFFNTDYKNISVLITPVDSGYNVCDIDVLDSDVSPIISPENVVTYAAVLSDETSCKFKKPPQYGVEYKDNDFMVYKVSTCSSKLDLTFVFNIFSKVSADTGGDGTPIKIGYCYVLPNELKCSEGEFKLPIICPNKHRPMGEMHGEYLVVRPTRGLVFDMQKSYSSGWKQSRIGLEVGHRGNGASFKEDINTVRENTIASMNTAKENGADFVEFDVQLSKDLIPVIYHDFDVCLSLKNKNNIINNEVLQVPLKDLTFDQLQTSKLYHVGELPSKERFNDVNLPDNQPFPLLEDFLTKIDLNLGFNVEIKWPMKSEDGKLPLKDSFDMNTYLDTILEVIFKHAKDRRIFFSCFHPEVCVMLSMKQNLYPVMFLTQGITKKWPKLFDPRCNTIQYAIFNALNSGLLGVVVHTEDLLRDPKQVILTKEAGLVLFCWGEDNNNKETIKNLKELGVHGIIFDRMDKFSSKSH